MIEDNLRAYFSSGAVICPYARLARFGFFSDDVSASSAANWAAVVLARSVAVICASPAGRDFEQAQSWCFEMLGKLSKMLRANVYKTFFGLGELNGTTFYTIGMGPQYPEHHPRYAPHLCLVAVNEDEIKNVPENARSPIRRAMVDRTGVVYDADHVWLAVQPEEKR